MFMSETSDLCTRTLNLVRCITVPKFHSLLGVHPILSVVCGTDDGSSVVEVLRGFRGDAKRKEKLLAVVQYCVHSSIYPHAKTVWAFNEPQSEILALKSYLDAQSSDVEDIVRLHESTYPFIEVGEHYTDPPIYGSERANPKPDKVVYTSQRVEEVPSEEDEFTRRTTPTLIVPTLALGSLYILSKLAKE